MCLEVGLLVVLAEVAVTVAVSVVAQMVLVHRVRVNQSYVNANPPMCMDSGMRAI